MAEDNLFTEAKDEALSFMNEVAGDVGKMFKSKIPYNQEPVSRQELTNTLFGLTENQRFQLISKYGRVAQDYFAELEL